jgi:exopolysaccharide biosynthesis polyprenyl glycosylphosphotransferase
VTTEAVPPPVRPGAERSATAARALTRTRARRGGRLARATVLRHGITPYLLVADAAALAVGVWVAGGLTGGLLTFAVATVCMNASAALYRSRLTLSILDQAPDLGVRALAAAALSSAVGLLLGAADSVRPLFVAAAVFVAVTVVVRSALFTVVRIVRRHGLVAHPTLVLGAGHVGRQIANALVDHPEYGLRPIGFLDSDPLLGDEERPAPLLGGTDELSDVILDTGAREVIIAFSSQPSSAMVDIIRTCDRLRCELFIVPRLFELHDRSGQDVEAVWGMPLLRMREAPFRQFAWKIKRLVDIVFSALLMLVLSPLLLACAVGVRLDGPGRILFRQTRVGLDGRAFELLKFRSIVAADDNESATLWSVVDDERLSRVGRFLRSTSFDELPQLWNVLRGDMSIVGPRPERPHFVGEFATTYPRYMARHRVPCGITGWAQIHGLRGDTSVADRARFDNYYIENWSLWLDLKIVMRTISVVLTGQGR